MVEGWEWDETLFSGTAAYYARGRLPYAPGLAQALSDVLRLDGQGRLLDVGCGPGTVALTLVELFREVVGVDPDGGMIAEAGRQAVRAGVAGKARWVRARAEELPAGLGTFTAVSFAQSFHWMERDLVAATVRDMLRPGGVLLHISDLKTAPPPRPTCPTRRRLAQRSTTWSGSTSARSDERVEEPCRRARPATRRRCSPAPDSRALTTTSSRAASP